jgi:hypothetical protein
MTTCDVEEAVTVSRLPSGKGPWDSLAERAYEPSCPKRGALPSAGTAVASNQPLWRWQCPCHAAELAGVCGVSVSDSTETRAQ